MQFIREHINNGANVTIAVLPSTVESKTKVRVDIRHGARAPMGETQALLLAVFGASEASAALTISVDRGHRRHSANTSEVGLWMTPRQHQPRARPDDGDGPSDGGSGPGGRPPRRGRSPPSDDPWFRSRGEPWSSAQGVGKPPKQSRTMDTRKVHFERMWVPRSTPHSSTTPDPPTLGGRRSHEAQVDSSAETSPVCYLAHVYQQCCNKAEQRHVRSYLSALYDRCDGKVEGRRRKFQDFFLAQLQSMHNSLIELKNSMAQTGRRCGEIDAEAAGRRPP